MEIFSHILQGSYAYVLIAQVLVVAGLLLALLWLIVQRTKSGVGVDEAVAAAGVSKVIETVVQTGGPEFEALKRRCVQLEEELAHTQKMRAEYESLQQKVKFLESKLLEYEILQEEIGTLSALKVENEKLKKELVTLQAEIDKQSAQKEAAQREMAAANAPPAAPVSASEPTPAPVADPSIAAPAAQTADPIPEPASAAASPETPAAAPSAESKALDGLLAEIDAIASAPMSPPHSGE